MNLKDYEELMGKLNLKCPVDEKLENQIEFFYKYIHQHQQSTSTTEMQVYNEILKKFKDVDYDEMILDKCRYGYSAIAIAYIGFQELKEEMLLLEASEKLKPSRLCKFIIKNNTLLAAFDKNLLLDPKRIDNIFYNGAIKVYAVDIYIHSYFKKEEEDEAKQLGLKQELNENSVLTPEENKKHEEERLEIENEIINKYCS
jgi:hypothetical protein